MTREPMEREPEAAEKLLRLMGGKWVAAAIASAASIGLADALAAGPRDVESLADTLSCDREALSRLLRVLAGEGIVELDVDRRYRLTELGEPLQQGALRDLAVYTGAPFMWNPWASLADTVRTGKAAFALTHGQGLFEYLDSHEQEARLYQAAVDAFTRHEAAALKTAFDFSRVDTVVDVGGGLGTLLMELLGSFPQLRGILYERPQVVEQARERHASTEQRKRCEFIGGDFFAEVPGGADVYIVMHVAHNWDDERAARLLSNCAAAMAPDGRVLVIDGLVLPGNRKDATRLLDLEMLALCAGGRERTKPEFRHLLHTAGLKLEHSRDLAGTTRLLVCQRRP